MHLVNEKTENEKIFIDSIKDESGMPYEKLFLKLYFDRINALEEGLNPAPYEVEWQPTSRCNANCLWCFAKEYHRTKDAFNTIESIDKVAEEILKFESDGFDIKIVKFCGSTGDPLMNKLTPYAIEKFAGKKFVRLFTNGLEIGRKRKDISYLERLSGVNRLNISLDAGSTKKLREIKPGAKNIVLEDILEGARKLREISGETTRIEIGYVITKWNFEEILMAAEKIKLFGAASIIRYRIDMNDRSISIDHGSEIKNLIDQAKKLTNDKFEIAALHTENQILSDTSKNFSSFESGLKCYVSNFWTCIGSNGEVYPCGHVASENSISYGNVLTKSFGEIWKGMKRKQAQDNLPISRTCKVCSPFCYRVNYLNRKISDIPFCELKQYKEKYIQ